MIVTDGIIKLIDRLSRRLANLEAAEQGTPWIALPYATGWTDYGSPYQNGEYKRVGRWVLLRGNVKRISGSSTTIATLPAGFQPPAREPISVIHPATATFTAARIDVQSTGIITFHTAGTETWLSLSAAIFSVD